MADQQVTKATPFLKWAGGKRQLLAAIEQSLPDFIKLGRRFNYIEPFVGGGAVLFYILDQYGDGLGKAVICDQNHNLIRAYTTIKSQPDLLLEKLQFYRDEYMPRDKEARKDFYYEKREEFNNKPSNDIDNTALMIFLNRTCFNGLYRVNKSGGFNVPFNDAKDPPLYRPDLINAISAALQRVEIIHGDYKNTIEHAGPESFFYFDPPYKPISKTSHFNSYTKTKFDDPEQIRLKEFCDEVNLKGSSFLLSNSDPKNKNPDDTFFEDLYGEYHIETVSARRSVNSKKGGRGKINELLITNPDVSKDQ
jgi:DNA adenine methylase